jgi:hypothetical protein
MFMLYPRDLRILKRGREEFQEGGVEGDSEVSG